MPRTFHYVRLSVLDNPATMVSINNEVAEHHADELVAVKAIRQTLDQALPSHNFQKVFRQLVCYNPLVLFLVFFDSEFGNLISPRQDLMSENSAYLEFLKLLLNFMTAGEMEQLSDNLFNLDETPAINNYSRLLDACSATIRYAVDQLANKFTSLVHQLEIKSITGLASYYYTTSRNLIRPNPQFLTAWEIPNNYDNGSSEEILCVFIQRNASKLRNIRLNRQIVRNWNSFLREQGFQLVSSSNTAIELTHTHPFQPIDFTIVPTIFKELAGANYLPDTFDIDTDSQFSDSENEQESEPENWNIPENI